MAIVAAQGPPSPPDAIDIDPLADPEGAPVLAVPEVAGVPADDPDGDPPPDDVGVPEAVPGLDDPDDVVDVPEPPPAPEEEDPEFELEPEELDPDPPSSPNPPPF